MKDKQRSTLPMKDKHTPGPWNEQSFGPWVYDDELAAVLTEDMTGTVARLLPPPSEMPDGAVDTELTRKVGTLIAAAPELLDALKALMDAQASHDFPVLIEARLKARALIDTLTDQ